MWFLRFSCVILSLVCWTVVARPLQEPVPTQQEPVQEYYSGTVKELPNGKITVARTIQGKAPESRTFLINSETVVEGKLRHNMRVTVGFKPSDEGDVAVRIIVRQQKQAPPPKK